jgi:hypothetical protein
MPSLIDSFTNLFKRIIPDKTNNQVKYEERSYKDDNLVVKHFYDDGTINTILIPTKEKIIKVRNDFNKLSDIMATGKSKYLVGNDFEYDISIDKVHVRKEDLLHIIEESHTKDKLDKNEITALLYKIKDAAKKGFSHSLPEDNKEFIGIEKDGIIAVVSRRKGTGKNFVITGYDINNKKEEATEAIKTVIANYGRTHEFSDLRKQVGIVISSLQQEKQLSPQPGIKPSEIETAKKAGYVQGVCECVAAVGSDYALGKKLLTEMYVTKKLAKQYASPETFKVLENGIFAQKQEQKLEHQQKRGHRR